MLRITGFGFFLAAPIPLLIGCPAEDPPFQFQDTQDVEVEVPDEVDETTTEDTEQDTPDTTDTIIPPTCECGEDEICVSNWTVTNGCFALHCPDEECGPGEVCYEDTCVGLMCAGVECADGEACFGGACLVIGCDSPDVDCPEGYECVDDVCYERCMEQADCDGLACMNGYCMPCTADYQCDSGSICVGGACALPCSEDPSLCSADQTCDPETGRCSSGCTSDSMCGEHQICDWDTGQCIPEECSQSGETAECEEGHICLQHRCVPISPLWVGSFSSGGGSATSSRYIGQFIFAPVAISGPPRTSDDYILYSGPIYMITE